MHSRQTRALNTISKMKHTSFSWPVLAVSAFAWFFAIPLSGEIAQAAGILDSKSKDVIRTLGLQQGKPSNKSFCVTGLPKSDPYLVLWAEPSDNTRIAGRVPNGSVVYIDDMEAVWILLKTRSGGDSPTGWVPAAQLAEFSREVKKPEECGK